MAKQIVVQTVVGPDRGEQWALPIPGGLVGRGEECAVRLTDDLVSTQHCHLSIRDGTVILRDLGSANGTRVNDKPVTETPVHPGDLVRVGATCLLMEAREMDTTALKASQRERHTVRIKDKRAKPFWPDEEE